MSRIGTAIRRTIPTSASLSDASWRARHRMILLVAAVHVVLVPAFGILSGIETPMALLESAPVAIFTLGGLLPLHRRLRAVSVTLALLLSSAALVLFAGGATEMHFHIFVMIPIIALYQDWLPFGVAVAFVFAHHGIVGTLQPHLVFEDPEAQAAPWRWAVVYAFFVWCLSIVCIAGWRINQLVLERQRRTERELLEEKQIVETLHTIGTGVVSELDIERVSQIVCDAAVSATGAAFGAFFYTVGRDEDGRYMLYTLSGASRSDFDAYPMPRKTEVFGPTFAGDGPVRSDDITADDRYGRNPPYAGMPPGHLPVRSYLAVPVKSRGSSDVIGGLFFGHPDPGVFDERHERIAVGIATQAAIAFDNARLYQAERDAAAAAEEAHTRLSMLADVGRALVSTLDPGETLARLASTVVPDFCDICVVDMVTPDGSLSRVACVGAPGLERVAADLGRFPPDERNTDHPVVQVIQGSAPVLVPTVTPDLIDRNTTSREHAHVATAMRGTSSIVAPMVGRGAPLGAVSFLTLETSGRVLRQVDVPLAETMARRAGMAMENAQLYAAEREARSEASRATESLSLLNEAGRLSATPLDEDIRVQQLAKLTVPALADACLIDVLEEDGTIKRFAAASPEHSAFADRIVSFPPSVDDDAHPTVAVMKGAPSIVIEDIDDAFLDRVTRSAEHREAAIRADVTSTIIVPLPSRGVTYGSLTLIDFRSSGRRFGPDDLPLVEEIGRRAGVAVHNARLYRKELDALAAAERAGERLSLLADASRVLGSSLDIETTLESVAELSVPSLADLCVIDMVDADGTMRRVAASGASGLETFAEQTKESFPSDPPPDHPVLKVMRGHGTQHIEHVDRGLLERLSRDEEWLIRVERTQVLSAIMVPLQGREEALGVLSLVTTAASGRHLPADDVPLAEELGRRAGVAIENARLYTQQRSAAERLQHALLPSDLPSVPGFEIAARYRPGGPGERVGGDWYDVFQIPTGELAVVMGDVVGHGIGAASLMAQLRNALRAYAWEGHAPSTILTKLNQLLYGLERDGMATAMIGLLDPITNTLRLSGAGHPPTLQLPGGTGDAIYVGEGLGPPLGAVPFANFRESLIALDENDTLVFYTDGLIEERTSSLDEGFRRMRTAVSDAAATGAAGAEDICDLILERNLGGRDVEDDVAVLVLRALRMRNAFTMRLPAEPRVLSSLRQTIRRWLYASHVDEDAIQDLLVASGEACNNAIEHGGITPDGWFEIEGRIDPEHREVSIEVRSPGVWRAPRDDGGGRGLDVIRHLTDACEIEEGEPSGIIVRMRRAVGDAVRADANLSAGR